MVEKRTLVFITLATIVWAATISAFAGYYYLQNTNSQEQLDATQNSLNEIAINYSRATGKYDSLLSEYALLRGNYSLLSTDDYAVLMPVLRVLVTHIGGNYSSLFSVQEDMNKTYHQLLNDYEALSKKGNITGADLGDALSECYNLLSLSAFREVSLTLGKATSLSINVEIDYGNETIRWYNETDVPAGQTLFGGMQKMAVINYTYYTFAEPGHIVVDSINGLSKKTDPFYTSGYSWIWYYYRNGKWISGPVGCDAWMLQSDGIYRWSYERWSYP